MDKEIPVNELDLAAISRAKTDYVSVREAKFDIKNERLVAATFQINVNVFGLRPKNGRPDHTYLRKTSRREARFSSIGGGYLSVDYDRSITFPLRGRTLKEFEALNEFCLMLRDMLKLDREFVAEHDQEPPDELSEARTLIAEMKNQIEDQKRQIGQLEAKLKKQADAFRAAAEGLE